ncbi:MAG TPA: hypothetical protein V6C82_06225 [Chroococcales cyanobacterium]|jgi:hypothetical protein
MSLYTEPIRSPWDQVDVCTMVAPGVWRVCTPCHGGYMVHSEWAKVNLTTAARAFAHSYGRSPKFFCFEEDCQWSILAFEHPELFHLTPLAVIKREVATWWAEYLLQRKIDPAIIDEEGYSRFKAMKLDDEMRKEQHPDLIVAAFGSWAVWVPEGQVGVKTADGKHHLVAASSYRSSEPGSKLLSGCEIVERDVPEERANRVCGAG